MTLNAEQIKKAKQQGFLLNRGTEMFSARIIPGNGILSIEEMRAACKASEMFGDGTVAFTTRQTIEIPGVKYEDISKFQEYIKAHELETGGTGNKIRPILCCKGTTCIYGLHDTQSLGATLHELFFRGYSDISFPHKIKISVGGCPNNCVKPDINDIGIMGQRVPEIHKELCRECKKCKIEEVCPVHAAVKKDGITISKECVRCGRCSEVCPFHAVDSKDTLYQIFLGGQWGKHRFLGYKMSRLIAREDVGNIIESAILFFKEEGIIGERFRQTIDRVGWEYAEKKIASLEPLRRKNEILNSVQINEHR